jgi:hypothetical protein
VIPTGDVAPHWFDCQSCEMGEFTITSWSDVVDDLWILVINSLLGGKLLVKKPLLLNIS